MVNVSIVEWLLCGFIAINALVMFSCMVQYAAKRL